MASREHTRSPWRIAFEALVATRNGGASESVTLKLNAKGGIQPEVVAVPQNGETLSEAAGRAESVYDALTAKYARPDTPFGPGLTESEAAGV